LLRFARNSLAKKGSPFGKPFHIVYVITQNVTGLLKASMMVMDVYSLFH